MFICCVIAVIKEEMLVMTSKKTGAKEKNQGKRFDPSLLDFRRLGLKLWFSLFLILLGC